MKLTSIYYLHEIGGKKNQEDYIWPPAGSALPDSKVFIICDGVGGSDNGEVASRMIAEYTGNKLSQALPAAISADYVNQLLAAAKENLLTYAAANGLNKEMATTFTLLVLFRNKAFIAWCGDSRVYHIRNGEVLYKTADHSLVNSLVKKGEITEAEAMTHPQKHIILKAITGDDASSEADTEWINDIAAGDYFMLCTDGLLENISDKDLKLLLNDHAASNTDIVAAMQAKCFGKTRDNYSMYLLQASPETLADTPVKKAGAKKPVMLVVLLALLVIGGLVFFFMKNATATNAVPVVVKDSVASSADSSAQVKKDTVLEPGKSALSDSELIREEANEKKIMPTPLPETKPRADTMAHPKMARKDSVSIHPKKQVADSQRQPVLKNDSSLKQDSSH